MEETALRLQTIGAPGDLISGLELDNGQARQIGRRGHVRGGVVDSVDSGSPMDRAGIHPGDVVVRVNERPLRDAIDYQFFTAGENFLRLELAPHDHVSESRTVAIARGADEPLGLSFVEPTFLPIRECNNHCPFCFIDQLPGSMRNSLYIRDDDYRYSFLFGNFVTLTNLNERDWERLAEQRLTPLYVSVHSTDLAMRRLLLGNKRAPDILSQLDRLFTLGIGVHAQIVACPGINDGEHLDQTVRDLGARYPNVLSIGVVPVGLTRTPQEILSGPAASCSRLLPSAADLPLRQFLPEEARDVVARVRRLQQQYRRKHDSGVVYASDEFYLLCGAPVPPAAAYDGYPQFENGIGMVRDLIDDWLRLRRRLGRHRVGRVGKSVTLVCAEMIAQQMRRLAGEWSEMTGALADVTVLRNGFFGPRVRVSGLLTGGDVVANAERYRGSAVILPAVMLDKTGTRTIDGMSPSELMNRLGRPVYFAAYISEVDRIVFDAESVPQSRLLTA